MQTVVLVIHVLLALAMIGVILMQRSEGGGLGIGGGAGNFMSARGSANLLTRVTTVLAACFMVTSIILALFASGAREAPSILDQIERAEQSLPETETRDVAPPAPAVPVSD